MLLFHPLNIFHNLGNVKENDNRSVIFKDSFEFFICWYDIFYFQFVRKF